MAGNLIRSASGHLLKNSDGNLTTVCCCGGGSCNCPSCSGATPRFLKVTLSGIGNCSCAEGDDHPSAAYTLAGDVNGTYCLAQTGAIFSGCDDNGEYTVCGWSGTFYPAGVSIKGNTVFDCTGGDDGSYGLKIIVTYNNAGGPFEVIVTHDPATPSNASYDNVRNDNLLIPDEWIFQGTTTTPVACTDTITCSNIQTDCGYACLSGINSGLGFGGTATIEPAACSFAGCVDTEPACSFCNGNTPHEFTVSIYGTTHTGIECITYPCSGSVNCWVSFDDSLFVGTWCLTRTSATSCTWTADVSATFSYYAPGDACGGSVVSGSGAKIVLTKNEDCTYTVKIVSDDGLVTAAVFATPDGSGGVTGSKLNSGGACGDFAGFLTGTSNLVVAIGTRCC